MARKNKNRCPYGVIKRGRRKGQCLKNKRKRR